MEAEGKRSCDAHRCGPECLAHGRAVPGVGESPSLFEQRAIDTSSLDTWDAAVVERFNLLQSAGSPRQESCALTVSRQCLSSLDRTVNELRRRTRSGEADPVASGGELADLRSAAVEVVAGAYVDPLVGRGRQQGRVGRRSSDERDENEGAREVIQRVVAQVGGATVVCRLSPTLVVGLNEVVDDVLAQNDLVLDESVMLETMRSVVVESALTAWLILRGSLSVTPGWQAPAGWFGSVASLTRKRAWRWRRRRDD